MQTNGLKDNQKVFREGLIQFPTGGDAPPHLLASRCSKCGKVYFPSKQFCAECMNEQMEEIGLSNRATLYTSTVVHIGVKGFETPYILGWVDLLEQVRLVTQIEFDPQRASELHAGQKLELVIGKLRSLPDGTEIVGYKYRPVE
jgi:uncharacterized OB-fold protein